MLVDESLCVGCGLCVDYCPVGAISMPGPVIVIEQDTCVECDVCWRSGVCPTDAFVFPELSWPRIVRRKFSDPLIPHDLTGVPGRGTEEMKTNDVTGRYGPGQVGIAVEMGRPGTSTSFASVQKVTRLLAGLGVTFEPENPVTGFMRDVTTGDLDPDILAERALSAIIECIVPVDKAPAVLAALQEIAPTLDTVFSLDIVSLAGDSPETSLAASVAKAAGLRPSINGKTNAGLGRPLAVFPKEER